MTKEEVKEKIEEIVYFQLVNNYVSPKQYRDTITNDITKYLMEEVVGNLLRERDDEIKHQERFAEQEGFTPDCSPYYIALQYKYKKEVSERELRVLARKFVIFAFPNGDWKELIEQLVSEVKEQAEKELAEEDDGKKEV